MQRYFALIVLFVFSLPVGLSIAGCTTNVGAYCNGLGYGPKTNAVASITLGPATTGISLSWGQIGQVTAPTAANCKGTATSVSNYSYGTSNLLLADISPTGSVCGGTWNRTSPGGIADYTICTPPEGANTEQCNATSCGVAQVTASGAGVTSNPVPIYVHPPITAITIDPKAQTSCTSQNQAGPLLTSFTTVLGPNSVPIPNGLNGAPNYVGTITYTPLNASIVTINNTSASNTGINGTTTANLPGSTVINAGVSATSSGSAAGYFYTCPPKTIALSINGSDSAVVNQNSPQNIAATITDTNGEVLNGLSLDYTSTRPQEIAVSASGQVSSTFPSAAAINAICQPGTCNPAPISQIGVFGTGLPVVGNPLSVTSPGRSSTILWMASTQSQFFSNIDLTTGVPGSPVKLPYPPNSMVLDQGAANLYFGSYRELMVYSATNNVLGKEDTNVPGVVLAVSPDSSTVVINDQLRQVIYLYTNSSSSATSIGGVATRAAFSPDGKNVYIVGPDTLYVHNASTGWSTYNISATQPTQSCSLNNNSPVASGTYDPFCGPDLAIAVPSIGPFITGTQTTAHGFCPNITVNPPIYYPQAAIVGATTEHLDATNSGTHILGASVSQGLTDIGVTIPIGPCPSSNTGIQLSPTFNQLPLAGISPSEIHQIVASPDSTIAFVTYNSASASGLLPGYMPSNTQGLAGTLTNVQLSGTAQAPIAGIFSPDETIFFVSTSGDNLVHFVDPVALKDTQTIKPNLTDQNGQPVPVQMLAVKPRSTT